MNKEKIHIGLVTTWFPPENGTAVNRMSAFARYLSSDNFIVSVFTVETTKPNKDETIVNGKVYRLSNKKLIKTYKTISSDSRMKHLMKVAWNISIRKVISDEYSSWKKNTILKLQEVHNHHPIDILISSYSPSATHEAASIFCLENPEVKWIVDMRDEMSQNTSVTKKDKIKFEKIEASINKRAIALTSVSKPILEYFSEIMPDMKNFEEIRNGYDHNIEPVVGFNSEFTIAYAGKFYGTRKPDCFFQALVDLKQEGFLNFDWKIKFIGSNHNFNIPFEFKNHVQFINELTSTEVIHELIKVDALLFFSPPTGRKGIFTGKIFEYISVEKPIIAIVDVNDVAADLIIEHNAGFVADYYDLESIKASIKNAVTLWKKKEVLNFDKKKIQMLQRKHQVDRLKELILKIV